VDVAVGSGVTVGIGEGLADDDAVGNGDGEVNGAGDPERNGNPTPLVNASSARTTGKTNDATTLGLLSNIDLLSYVARTGCCENSLIISRLNAGMSAGLRLVTRFPSTTTSWSTHSAPALRRSSWMLS